MKNEYIAPDCELIRFKLSKDILGDSKPESHDSAIYNSEPDVDDPFANG